MNALILALGLSAFVPFAQAHEGACKADIEKFCANVKPGKGAIMLCLHENKEKLSPECKAQGEKMKEYVKENKEEFKKHRQEFQEACAKDLETLCADAKGPKQKVKCLAGKEDQVSEPCKTEAKKIFEKIQEKRSKKNR